MCPPCKNADYAMENPRVSVQARVKIPDVNLNAQAMIDVQSKQSLTLTVSIPRVLSVIMPVAAVWPSQIDF